MLTYNLPPKEVLDKDDLFNEAVKLIQESGKASTSLIQRRLKLGYARSARLLDQLEVAGVVGPENGAKPRKILIPHNNEEGQIVTPSQEPEPKFEPEPTQYEEPPIKWNKTKYADNRPDNFEVELGVDEKNKAVSLNLERYGNLLVIGSQFTAAVDLLNNILATNMAKYSPDELRIIAIDGVKGDLIVPNQASHLLVPMIVDPEKSISVLKWSVSEMERRYKTFNEVGDKDIKSWNYNTGFQGMPSILIVINSLNQILKFSPEEVEDNLYRLISTGKKCGFYFVIGTDYPNPRTSKEIIANSPSKLVFKPTDKKIARDTGIPESVDLISPDEAILETMFEGKKKITINKLNPKEIYDEIFK